MFTECSRVFPEIVFEIQVDEEEKFTMIDFPQMVSTSHANAKMYFERDAECLRIYFARKFNVDETDGLEIIPKFEGNMMEFAVICFNRL
jgi:RIO-like serine/threonine protein kinase